MDRGHGARSNARAVARPRAIARRETRSTRATARPRRRCTLLARRADAASTRLSIERGIDGRITAAFGDASSGADAGGDA